MKTPFFKIQDKEGPLIVTAIHNGHFISDELQPYLALNDKERIYEEDPYTGFFADIGSTTVAALHSRFEIDLNRDKAQAIYQKPEQAWGLKVYTRDLPLERLKQSQRYYDEFYAITDKIINSKIKKYGFALIFDLHSYNFRRSGAEAEAEGNPDINVGTKGMDRSYWADAVDAFTDSLKDVSIGGRKLDVRENIKFQGGFFPARINQLFRRKACALAIEFKKIFMDEWSNQADPQALNLIRDALSQAAAKTLEAAERIYFTKRLNYANYRS